ncbi:MAG: SwmB domain-containing protein [Rikenellaceae bacterium]
MKYNKYITKLSLLAFAATLTIGCESEYVPVDTVSDTAWYNSEGNESISDRYLLKEGEYISFISASQGVVWREWTVDDNCEFLSDSFDCNEDVASQVDPSKGTTSSNAVESVYFGNAGYATVTLTEAFEEQVVTHDGSDIVSTLNDEGLWVITKQYVVSVFGTIQPAFRVTAGDQVLEVAAGESIGAEDTWAVFEVETGEDILFEDLTYEVGYTSLQPSRTWSVPASTEVSATSSSAYFSFISANDEGYSGFSITSSRTSPSSSVSKDIPLRVVVVPAPLKITKSEANVDDSGMHNTITLTTNSLLASTTDLGFTVSITTVEGVEVEGVEVTGVEIDSTNTKLTLTLNEKIFPGETVTLSYDPEIGGVTTVDDALLEAQDNLEITNNIFSILDSTIYGLEESTLAFSNTESQWYATTTSVITREVDPAGAEGNYVGKLSLSSDQSAQYSLIRKLTATPLQYVSGGDYILRHKIYVESGNIPSTATYYIDYKHNNEWFVDYTEHTYPTTTGQWIEQEFSLTCEDMYTTSVQLRIVFPTTTTLPAGTVIYFDDFQLIPVRPSSSEE